MHSNDKILNGTDNALNIKHNTGHIPVLLNEVLKYLEPRDNAHYLDCTFGAGGYTNAILNSANCIVTALDQDPTTQDFANEMHNTYGKRFNFIQTNFAQGCATLPSQFDAIILDLGVSSMQLDSAERGFSFMRDGPLDMRMNRDGISAEQFINNAPEEEIANIIYKYGEEVQSRHIARNIIKHRSMNVINSTLQFAQIVRESMHYRQGKIDPATKTFQAIRIYINKELENLENFLSNIHDMLSPYGKIMIVSFHSLEDHIVKSFFRSHAIHKIARSKYSTKPQTRTEQEWLNIITKKPITPSRDEIISNARSRSAKLRIAQKIGG